MSIFAEKTTYTLAEAADVLSCHAETLRRAIREGELKAAKLGRDYRVSRSDLESFWVACGGGELFGPVKNKETVEQASSVSVTESKEDLIPAREKKIQPEQWSLLDL